ncbi:MAG: oxygen-independent coproporphyrinogen III oxidase [Richelia sp. RM2_1_2]|nr:oxygen-independent coproporphyrinogen III oxidase [Richelia sp. SM2_1_7]NJM22299.1 oxygen-independent coproporphyrinogen III oxidase [Richelia sp. SM1_7_0]NJN07343.1 oxygen-independent coproporphyrinogen III oxidase [Richelia sp. RM1_1_1]NJO31329.1 oxygen-independent coproporphyrinogen III oxidase [Richelia sp. SL_2_1]NJO63051.1 oxygen-independent coproporphyrinogen III oxidase [Richelia sp. RM2_1_2]
MVFQFPGVKFDLDIIKKYDTPTPRYTSYPPATELNESFTAKDFEEAISLSNHRKTPLSLYFHIPFCESACYYCGCNTVISNKKEIAIPYVKHLIKEIRQTASLIDSDRKVVQMHWGGGTPNYLNIHQVKQLWGNINQYFNFDVSSEVSIEIHPAYVDRDYILFLREIGFNRISFGIQDFNYQVQVAVNRVQPEETLFNVMGWIREAGFKSVNVDLIYGLPYQTLHGFWKTVKKTIELNPDRIAVFNFAYVPWLKPLQKKLPVKQLPQPQEKLEIFRLTIEELTANQYQFIGMDHFAKADDELAIAQSNGSLGRTFQGYTTHAETELFGFGSTSVSLLRDAYAQNYKKLKDYYQAVEAGVLPINKGYKLSWDDILRRDVIMSIMARGIVCFSDIESKYQINFHEYFSQELATLKLLEIDGLINLSTNQINVTQIGRLLVRNIAVIFDSRKTTQKNQFSRAI